MVLEIHEGPDLCQGPDLLHLPTTNGEHCTGDAIKMGEAIGAATIDLEWVQAGNSDGARHGRCQCCERGVLKWMDVKPAVSFQRKGR